MSGIRALILLCAWTGIVAAQAPLQLGTPIERAITPGQSHFFTVVADEKTLVQITVEQRGIDVVVRVHQQNKKVAEYDSPNGADGPENVSFVSTSKAPYQIEVTPLSREPGPSGKFEIRLIELRPATEQEIKQSKAQEVLKARGLALLNEIEGVIAELRLPQTRIKSQMQAAGLLWESDEKRALKYVTDAVTGFKELVSNVDPASKDYIKSYHVTTGLRYEIVQVLTVRQPEIALSFLRSTPPLPDPYGHQRDVASHETATELEIANRLAEKDPKRTLEIARENVKAGRYSLALTNTIVILHQQNAELAAELANELATKLLGEKLLTNTHAGQLMIGLVQISAPPRGNQNSENNGAPRRVPLLSEQLRRDLLQRAMNEALNYKVQAPGRYSPERDYALGLLSGLQSMGSDADVIVSGSAAAVEKKMKEIQALNPRMDEFQQYNNAINNTNMPVDEVIQILSKAPREQRDHLYVSLSNRVMNSGDLPRARQILNDYVTAPYQRQQALYNLETQEIYRAMSKGKIEDALRNVANLSSVSERAALLSQMANQIGPGYKRAVALNFLEQARALLPPSVQAQDHAHLQALLEIAKAYSRYETKRAFEIVDPVVDQFNELSAAARTLEGFGGEFYIDEELNLQNGNVIATIATQLTSALGTLALTDFDRAKLTADRLKLPEVRLRAYLDIAQQAIQNQR